MPGKLAFKLRVFTELFFILSKTDIPDDQHRMLIPVYDDKDGTYPIVALLSARYRHSPSFLESVLQAVELHTPVSPRLDTLIRTPGIRAI